MSTGYVVRFVLTMTVIVALLLAFMYEMWKGQFQINEAIFNKRAILSSVESYLGTDANGNPLEADKISDEEVLKIFEETMEQKVLNMKGEELTPDVVESQYGITGGKAENIDMAKEKKKPEEERLLPLYIFSSDKGTSCIFSVRGSGLWDDIWGSVAVKDDLSTIAGTAFDHKGETPGLGAEIKDNPSFPARFVGKKIYDSAGKLVAVNVVKGKAKKGDPHSVDGISGATVTATGVQEMLKRGIAYYEPYINSLKMK